MKGGYTDKYRHKDIEVFLAKKVLGWEIRRIGRSKNFFKNGIVKRSINNFKPLYLPNHAEVFLRELSNIGYTVKKRKKGELYEVVVMKIDGDHIEKHKSVNELPYKAVKEVILSMYEFHSHIDRD